MKYSDISNQIEDAGRKFNRYFGMSGRQFRAFMDPTLTMITGKFEIDIIKFDDWLHQQGYEEEDHGSARDYIESEYGKEALEFIEVLLRR